jgi:hypothetical protein
MKATELRRPILECGAFPPLLFLCFSFLLFPSLEEVASKKSKDRATIKQRNSQNRTKKQETKAAEKRRTPNGPSGQYCFFVSCPWSRKNKKQKRRKSAALQMGWLPSEISSGYERNAR